ncbi:MAG: molybdate ABC transporter substrate-binding protein [Candidatus Aquicultor sp.]|nr:molybdate ABC transporter substrate-binding protein [Candidatus Aquicultor sp.]
MKRDIAHTDCDNRIDEAHKQDLRILVVLPIIAILFLAASALAGCTSSKSAADVGTEQPLAKEKPTTLRIMAATSLKDVLQTLAPEFESKENAKIIFSFASSGDLQMQIEQGAPADLFISAGKKQMDALEEKDLILPETRFNILGNDLVVIVPEQEGTTISVIDDVLNNRDIKKLAICIPETSPAGKYAQEALIKAGIWEGLQPKLVMAKDVRQVVTYVETGNVDAGLVYRSDVHNSKASRIAHIVASELHSPIVYPVAALADTSEPVLAAKFIEYLRAARAASEFEKSGYTVLSE